jgi:sialidase-1
MNSQNHCENTRHIVFKVNAPRQLSFSKTTVWIIFYSLLVLIVPGSITGQVLWEKGKGNYNNYRIPSLLTTQKGTIIAFCEGREADDAGNIDLLMKRSEDNGKTWSSEKVIWDDGENTCGNPCPVQDIQTGRIWLFMLWGNGKDNEKAIIRKESLQTKKPFVCWTDDEGKSWSEPEDLSASCKDPAWGWYAVGPGIGIQMKKGKYKGRLVIPANHSYDDPGWNIGGGPFGYGAHVLFSNDSGKTWQRSEPIRPGCNESQVAELGNGTLIMNMRSYSGKQCRAVSFSHDGGKTWSEVLHDPQLVESVCQASLLQYGKFRKNQVYLFSNPAVTSGRTQLTIKASFDDCRTWPVSKLIWQGPSAYSCLTRMSDRRIGILFEAGEKSPYETIRFESFPPGQIIHSR